MTKSHLFARFILKHFSTVLVFILTFLIYFTTNPSLPKRFDHQIYLADSLLKGHVDLVYYPIKYHDVFNIEGKKYTAFGLGPILLILPLVAIFGYSLNLTLIAMIIGSANVSLFWDLTKHFAKSPFLRIISTVGFGFGTIHWFSATVGTSWYFSMIVAIFFAQLTLLFIWKHRFILAGMFFGLAVLSRFPLALAAPGLILMIKNSFQNSRRAVREVPDALEWTPAPLQWSWHERTIAASRKFILGALPFAFLFFAYNYLRFGKILETGYQFANWQYMTELNTSSFGLKYFPKNFYTFAFRSFDFITEFPYLQVSFGGIALLFSSPWLFLSLAADIKNRINQSLILIIIPILGSSLLYFTPGVGIQPSWRFVMDFLPFAALLSLEGMKKIPKQLTLILISASLIFTAIGLYWAKISGW